MRRLWIHIRHSASSAGRSLVPAAAGVVLFYAVLARAGIGCPIRFLSGISCAGCGMSRAWLSLLRGDFVAAAFYHPLFWLPPLAVLVWLLRGRLPRKLAACLAWTACALFLAVYAWRMADPEDSIVVFHPESGLLFRSWRTVLRFLKK